MSSNQNNSINIINNLFDYNLSSLEFMFYVYLKMKLNSLSVFAESTNISAKKLNVSPKDLDLAKQGLIRKKLISISSFFDNILKNTITSVTLLPLKDSEVEIIKIEHKKETEAKIDEAPKNFYSSKNKKSKLKFRQQHSLEN